MQEKSHSPNLDVMREATEAQVSALILPVLDKLGYELVRVQLAGARGGLTLQIMAERADGKAMLVEDCRAITSGIDLLLDEADPIPGAYALEVSSPGIDRPLTRAKDYGNWAGHEIKLSLREPQDGQKNFKGLLKGLRDGMVALTADGKDVAVPYSEIVKAQLVLTDALIKATAAKEAAAAGLPEETAANPVKAKPSKAQPNKKTKG